MTTLNTQIENLTDASKYDEAAQLVADKLGFTFKAKFLKNDIHFEGEKEKRDIYTCTIERGSRSYTFNFGQSITDSQYYLDEVNGEEYTTSGGNKKGQLIVTELSFLNNYCVLRKGKAPTLYSVLSCLTKYDIGDFQDFCGEFGYDEDSRSAERIYNAVSEEAKQMQMLFTDTELETLQLIQ